VLDQAVRPAKLFMISGHQNIIRHQFIGRLDAAQTLDVSFEVDGALLALPLREGQAVSKGDLVAALDPTDFELAVREAQVQLRLANQDLRRKQSLLQERGISQSAVDDAQATHDLSQVRLAQARERLAKSRITAPFDAFVARRYVDNRTKVRNGDKIVRLSDLSELKVIVSLSEDLVATVTPERVISMTAKFDFLPDQEFPLTYRENTGEANVVAQTFMVSFTMDRPPQSNLLPGMTALVQLVLKADDTQLQIAIPPTALVSAPDGHFFVWIYDPDTQSVSRRKVTVAEPGGRGVGIASGLGIGELVVAAGASQLQEGMKIRLIGDPETQL
jgi:RND family efflux transporter MFP subunit